MMWLKRKSGPPRGVEPLSGKPTPVPREIWVLIAAAFAIAVGFGLIAPVLPQFAKTMSVTVFATTVVTSAFAAFRLIGAAPAGMLVTWMGERRTYIAGVLIVAASSAAIAFAQDYWQLLLFRALGGIGSVMFTVSAMGLLIQLAPPAIRGRVSALYASTFLIGSVLGPVLGGLLASFGMRVPFLVYAGTLGVAACLIWMLLPPALARPRGAPPVSAADGAPPLRLSEALADPAYPATVLVWFGNGWGNFGVRIAVVPLFVAAFISEEAWVAGLVMAAFAVGNVAALPFSSRFADARGRKPLIVVGAVVAGLFTGLIGFATELPLLLAISLVAGVGAGTLNPGAHAAIADVIGSKRSAGSVIAAASMVTDIGSILGPLIAGVIVDSLNYRWAFLLTGLVMASSSLAWISTPDTLARARAAARG